jgi:tRNA (mo5U34)-methyltransferase
MSNASLAHEVESIIWFHSIDLGGGVVTPGIKSPEALDAELGRMGLPEDLSGRTVLDIGAWDGYFSFEAERRGAKRVVALDHYAWSLDHDAQRRYWAECQARGEAPLPYEQVPGLFDPTKQPGRRGFDLARARLRSSVEPIFGDLEDIDAGALGTFDIVFFMGVLYHLENPLRALRRLRQLTAGVVIVETVCAVFPGMEDRQMFEFFGTDELNGDPSNWWAPNAAGLDSMCRAAGFRDVVHVAEPSPDDPPHPGYRFHYGRAVFHALA